MSQLSDDFDEDSEYSIGTVLWINLDGYPWWPARVIHESECDFPSLEVERIPKGQILVEFFNDQNHFCLVEKKNARPFPDAEIYKLAKSDTTYRKTIIGAAKEAKEFMEVRRNTKSITTAGAQRTSSTDLEMRKNRKYRDDRLGDDVQGESGNERQLDKQRGKRRPSDADLPPSAKSRSKGGRDSNLRHNLDGKLMLSKSDTLQRKQRKRSPSPPKATNDDSRSSSPSKPAQRKPNREVMAKNAETRQSNERLKRRQISHDHEPTPRNNADDVSTAREPIEDQQAAPSKRMSGGNKSAATFHYERESSDSYNSNHQDDRSLHKRRTERDRRESSKFDRNVEMVTRVEERNNRRLTKTKSNNTKRDSESLRKESSSEDELSVLGKRRGENDLGTFRNVRRRRASSPEPATRKTRKQRSMRKMDIESDSNDDRTTKNERGYQHLKDETMSEGNENQNLSKAESDNDKNENQENLVNICTDGTWNWMRIADYVPNDLVIQPLDKLSRKQLFLILKRREIELRRCRLQTWKVECELEKDRLSNGDEVEIAFKKVEGAVKDLVHWVHSRSELDTEKKRNSPQTPIGDGFMEHLSDLDKQSYQEKEENICGAAHELRRMSFDPSGVEFKDNLQRLVQAMEAVTNVSRRTAFCLKDLISHWTDIYMFKKKDTEKRRRVESNGKDDHLDTCNDKNRDSEPVGLSHRDKKSSWKGEKPDASDEVKVGYEMSRDESDSKDRFTGAYDPHSKNFKVKDEGGGIRSSGKGSLGNEVVDDEKSSSERRERLYFKKNTTNDISRNDIVDSHGTGDSVQRKEKSRNHVYEKEGPDWEGGKRKLTNGVKRASHDSGSSSDDPNRNEVKKRRTEQRGKSDFGQKETLKRGRTGFVCNERGRLSDEKKRKPVDGDYSDSEIKSRSEAPGGRKNGSFNSGGASNLSKERYDTTMQLTKRLKMLMKKIDKTLGAGERSAKDWSLLFDQIEKEVYLRCGRVGEKYRQSITSVTRSFQQLAQKVAVTDEDPKALKNDEVAIALRRAFRTIGDDSSSAIERLVSLCVSQTKTDKENRK